MQKGVSQIILALLLLLISTSLVIALYLFSTGTIVELFPNQTQEQFQRSRACLSLEEINLTLGEMEMKNCGKVPLRNFLVFIDGSNLSTTYPEKLEPTESTTIGFSPLFGEHNFLAISDLAETALIKVVE